jgi:hypothetical protein
MKNSDLEDARWIDTAAHSGTHMSRDPRVWRYMDLLSLLFLLQKKELHFSHLRDLQRYDQNEGTGGLLTDVVNNTIVPSVLSVPTSPAQELQNRKEIQKIMEELKVPLSKNLPRYKKQVRRWDQENANVYISCWHTSEIESDFMWRVYAKHEYGFAVVSSAQTLLQSLLVDGIKPAKIGFGFIRYPTRDERIRGRLDLELGSWAAFIIKDPAFAHENEFRVFVKTRKRVDSCDMSVDLKQLIHEIRLSPLVPDWAQDPLLRTLNPICKQNDLPLIEPKRINLRIV